MNRENELDFYFVLEEFDDEEGETYTTFIMDVANNEEAIQLIEKHLDELIEFDEQFENKFQFYRDDFHTGTLKKLSDANHFIIGQRVEQSFKRLDWHYLDKMTSDLYPEDVHIYWKNLKKFLS